MRVTQAQYERLVGLVRHRRNGGGGEPMKTQSILRAAACLARQGRLHEAEQALAGAPLDGPVGPETLDLKARILAQQGRLVEAQLCWLEAVRQSPGNPVYRRSLNHVTRDLRPFRFPWMTLGLIAVGIIALTTLLRSVAGA